MPLRSESVFWTLAEHDAQDIPVIGRSIFFASGETGLSGPRGGEEFSGFRFMKFRGSFAIANLIHILQLAVSFVGFSVQVTCLIIL